MLVSRRKLGVLAGAMATSAFVPKFGAAQTTPTAKFLTAKHGEIDFYGPEIVVPAGGWTDLRPLIKTTYPVGGPGGVITFAGDVQVQMQPLAGRGNFLIRKQPGAVVRPKITAMLADGSPIDFAIYSFPVNTGFAFGSRIVLDGLEITGSQSAMKTNGPEGQVVHDCYIHDNGNTALWWSRIGDSTPGSAIRFGWGEVLNTELSRSGGSPRHNTYMNGQEFVYVSGLFTHSSKHHPFKFVGDRLLVENSLFRTWWQPGMTDEEITQYLLSVGATDPYVSVNLINMDSDCQSIIRNNVFVHHRLRNDQQPTKGRSPGAIGLASRNSTWSANEPWYGSHEFWEHHADDPSGPPVELFWDRAGAGGYDNIENPELFRHVVNNNQFIETGGEDSPSRAIWLTGTSPAFPNTIDTTGFCAAAIDAINTWPGSKGTGQLAPRPTRWRERAALWAGRNTFEGSQTPYNDQAQEIEGLGVPHIFDTDCPPDHPAF